MLFALKMWSELRTQSKSTLDKWRISSMCINKITNFLWIQRCWQKQVKEKLHWECITYDKNVTRHIPPLLWQISLKAGVNNNRFLKNFTTKNQVWEWGVFESRQITNDSIKPVESCPWLLGDRAKNILWTFYEKNK